ncbi:hypothetical protein Tco_1444011 [Tanacetum coccineum]
MFQDFRYSNTTHLSRSVEVLKLKNFKKDATLKLFKIGMSMSIQKSQVHKMAKFQDGKEIVLALGAAIGKAIEKGMQDGLSARITRGKEELKSNKDDSIEVVMDILHLEGPLTDKLRRTLQIKDQLFMMFLFLYDYEVIGANDQAVVDGSAASFPNVDDAELNIVK